MKIDIFEGCDDTVMIDGKYYEELNDEELEQVLQKVRSALTIQDLPELIFTFIKYKPETIYTYEGHCEQCGASFGTYTIEL